MCSCVNWTIFPQRQAVQKRHSRVILNCDALLEKMFGGCVFCTWKVFSLLFGGQAMDDSGVFWVGGNFIEWCFYKHTGMITMAGKICQPYKLRQFNELSPADKADETTGVRSGIIWVCLLHRNQSCQVMARPTLSVELGLKEGILQTRCLLGVQIPVMSAEQCHPFCERTRMLFMAVLRVCLNWKVRLRPGPCFGLLSKEEISKVSLLGHNPSPELDQQSLWLAQGTS